MTREIKRTLMGDAKTNLEPTLTGIPWGKGFDYGMGVDAITGSLTGSAVQHFTPSNTSAKKSVDDYRFVQSQSTFDMEVGASASGKYNIEGVNVSASTEFLYKLKFSELSITLVAQYQSQPSGYDRAQTYVLTDEAKKLISNPAAFREAYGDYFIAGGLPCSRFTAVYICQASSAESMMNFKASLGAETPDVFSAEGSASFKQSTSKHNINLEVHLWLEGYEGKNPVSGPWTPEKIIQALSWFKDAEKGIYLEAMLMHYNTIVPDYPRTIDIAPPIFTELSRLYTTVWDIRSRYASCPEYYRRQFHESYQTLDIGVPANKGALATDAESRMNYQHQANNLLSQLDVVLARQDFYQEVKKAIGTEPANGAEIEEGAGQQRWLYGKTSYPKSSAVVISSVDMHYAEDWQIGWREHTFEFGPDGRYLIVGWQVISNWGDSTNGSWWKATDQILLTHYAAVHVKSKYDRGCDWGLRVYYVEAKDYQF